MCISFRNPSLNTSACGFLLKLSMCLLFLSDPTFSICQCGTVYKHKHTFYSTHSYMHQCCSHISSFDCFSFRYFEKFTNLPKKKNIQNASVICFVVCFPPSTVSLFHCSFFTKVLLGLTNCSALKANCLLLIILYIDFLSFYIIDFHSLSSFFFLANW